MYNKKLIEIFKKSQIKKIIENESILDQIEEIKCYCGASHLNRSFYKGKKISELSDEEIKEEYSSYIKNIKKIKKLVSELYILK